MFKDEFLLTQAKVQNILTNVSESSIVYVVGSQICLGRLFSWKENFYDADTQ